MQNLILFDQNILHYRQAIYKGFSDEFKAMNINLVVCYDKNLVSKQPNDDLFKPIAYTFSGFNHAVKTYKPQCIILFVWLKYRYLLPFMLLQKLKGLKQIIWTHGAHLPSPYKAPNRQLHLLRHALANAHIIYSPNELKLIPFCKKKVFIANNTLNFNSFPVISDDKNTLKAKYNLEGKKVILSVARWNDMNRKPHYITDAMALMNPVDVVWLVIGPGLSETEVDHLKANPNIHVLGEIYSPQIVNEYYKLADVFVMPGGLGLAINQAFYQSLPIIIEDIEGHSPEVFYLKEDINGLKFKANDMNDLIAKLKGLLQNDRKRNTFAQNAKITMDKEGSFENMVESFKKTIEWVLKN